MGKVKVTLATRLRQPHATRLPQPLACACACACAATSIMDRGNSLFCFTELKKEPDGETKDEFEFYFDNFGANDIKWKEAKVGKWNALVNFPETIKRQSCVKKSAEKIAGIRVNLSIRPTGDTPNKSLDPHRKPFKRKNVSSPHPQKKISLSETDCLSRKILKKMRKYGKEKKAKYWTEFAVLLVLPDFVYQDVKLDINLLNKALLDEYSKTSVPSSFVSSLDDCEDAHKLVLHAEAKLVGDPKRHPVRLAVPYDRSSLVNIIKNRRKQEWLKEEPKKARLFKMFLYSEVTICCHCKSAIVDSVFCNLVEKNFCDDGDFRPVVGYGFADDDIGQQKKHKIQFFVPVADIPSQMADSVKRNLKPIMESSSFQSTSALDD